MAIDFEGYDPLAPTPERKRSRDDTPQTEKSEEPKSLSETVNAELSVKSEKEAALKERHEAANERWRSERQETERAFDWETQKLRIKGETLDQAFQRAAQEQPKQKSDLPKGSQGKSGTWRESARAQVNISDEREAALNRHETIWKIREHRMGAGSVPAPAPPGMEGVQKSPQEQYREARQLWEQQRDAINGTFDESRDDVRANGVTLTDLHHDHAGQPEIPASSPEQDVPQVSPPDGFGMDAGSMDAGWSALDDDRLSPGQDFADASNGLSHDRDR
jgi:hypothetical protein